MIDEIQEHFRKWYPKEGCGIIGIVKGKKEWFPCDNLADNEEDFILDPKQYIQIRKKADIYAIVHSHPDSSPEPSEHDIKHCNVLGVKYWIFSYPEMDLFELEPKQVFNNLIGREYEFGVYDCLEAGRDYYKKYLNIDLPKRSTYLDDWWEHGHNYFTDEHIKEWGFSKVDKAKPNDLLIFTLGAKVPNHCGIYIGDDVFFHHAANRLSCRESLYPLWIKYLTGIYRYDS